MADVNIKGQVSIDTSAAEGSMTQLNATIKDAKKALADTKIGSNEYKAAQIELAAAQKQLQTATESANQTHEKSSEAFGILKGKVQGLVPGLAGAESGVGSFGKALKILAMNPIMLILTAIVAVLTFVYEAFNNTSAGAKKTAQVFAGISATFTVLTDAAFILGRSLIDMVKALMSAYDAAIKFLSFDFAGAKKSWEDAKNSAKDIGDQAVEAAGLVTKALSGQIQAQGEAIKQQAQEIVKRQRQADEDKEKVEKKLKVSRELLTDIDNHDMAAKKKALAEVTAAEKTQAAVDLDLAERRLANRKRFFALETDGEKKNADEMSQLRMAVDRAGTQSIDVGIKLNRQKRMLSKQGDAIDKEASDAQKARDDEAKDRAEKKAKMEKDMAEARAKGRAKDLKDIEDYGKQLAKDQAATDAAESKRIFDNEQIKLKNKKKYAELALLNDPNRIDLKIAKINADLALELSTLEAGDLQRQILQKKANDEINKINQDAADKKKEIDDLAAEHTRMVVKTYTTAADDIAGVLGKQTLAGKLLAMAASTINTFQSITAQLAAFGKVPIPGYAIAQAVATGAVGFANVAKIAAVQVPGGGGGNMPTPARVSSPLAPMAQSMNTRLDQSSINGIGNAAQGGTNRTFVLDSDIKNSAERMARINRAARLN